MCIEIEAFVRVSAAILLIFSVMNALFMNSTGKLLNKNRNITSQAVDDTIELKKYGFIVVGLASFIIKASRHLSRHPYRFLLYCLAYFILALYLPGALCD